MCMKKPPTTTALICLQTRQENATPASRLDIRTKRLQILNRYSLQKRAGNSSIYFGVLDRIANELDGRYTINLDFMLRVVARTS